MPTNENVLPLDKIKLNPNSTHGKYIALNRVPNQKLTMTSLFNWHQMYSTDKIIGSISSCNDTSTQLVDSKLTLTFTLSTYRQIKEDANYQTAQPIEDQQEEIVAGTRLEMIGLQTKWIVIQEITIQHEMEPGGRIQWIVENARRQSPYLREWHQFGIVYQFYQYMRANTHEPTWCFECITLTWNLLVMK